MPHPPLRPVHSAAQLLGLLGASALLAPSAARAEGYRELGDQNLQGSYSTRHETIAYVDILDPDDETIVYTSTTGEDELDDDSGNTITVYDPDGALLGTFGSGEEIVPTAGLDGAYTIYFDGDSNDEEANFWDVSVYSAASGTTVDGGRLWSYTWGFYTGTYKESGAFNGSFYALVSMGTDDDTAVVELLVDGLSGASWEASANSTGVSAPYSGYSVDFVDYKDASYAEEYRLYLNTPAVATYAEVDPGVSGEALVSTTGEACGIVVPESISGVFTFDSDVGGTYHIVCDTDGDGSYDLAGADDLALSGAAVAGTNEVEWDGADTTGAAVDEGDYDCRVYVTVGEFHYVATDVETIYEGLRLFRVNADESRDGLDMYWNDELAPDGTITEMPNGAVPAVCSDADGVNAGDYDDGFESDPDDADYNSRGWGDFTGGTTGDSRGDNAYLDTYAFLAIGESAGTLTVSVQSAPDNADGDCFDDAEEQCLTGTDPDLVDTDDDYIDDCDEIADPYAPTDTDGDGLNDALDEDDDGDGLNTQDEGYLDSDGDGVYDHLDTDSDNDGLLDELERDGDTDHDGWMDSKDPDDDDDGIDTTVEGGGDTDGDGVADNLDEDSDGDGRSDAAEGTTDTDEDGAGDWVDADDDGDGIDSLDEGDGDSDGDGDGDWLDPDDDDDGIETAVESDEDSDGDGTPNHLDLDSDDDGRSDAAEGTDDLDADQIGNWLDPDDDGDGLATIDEVDGDSDDDSLADAEDPDDDGDGVPTADEDTDGDGDWTDDDADEDGTPDYLDAVFDTPEPDDTGEEPVDDTDEPADDTGDGPADDSAVDGQDSSADTADDGKYNGGCGCASADAPRSGSVAAVGLALLALAGTRRRR